ncbi:hypothetical protein D6C80_09621 [Aureobasidium pullulans]|nr:hypothetical protein D6C80_09621 [Aureobasidium pullulans]
MILCNTCLRAHPAASTRTNSCLCTVRLPIVPHWKAHVFATSQSASHQVTPGNRAKRAREQAHPSSSSIDRILSADTPNKPSSCRSLQNRKASAPTFPKVAHPVSTAPNADTLPSKNDAEYPYLARDVPNILSGSGNSFSNQLDAMHRDLGNSLDDIGHSIDDLRRTIMEFRADITGFSQSSKSAAEYNGYYGKKDEVEEEEVYEWEKDDCMDKFA